MPFVDRYATQAPDRAEVDAMPGGVVVVCGRVGGGHCLAARPQVLAGLAAHRWVRHVKVEDGRGRRLGRTFGVKLWPTRVFLRDGVEVARVVRATDTATVARAFTELTGD